MAILNNQRIKKTKNTYDVSLSMTPVDYMMYHTSPVETKKESKVLLMGFFRGD